MLAEKKPSCLAIDSDRVASISNSVFRREMTVARQLARIRPAPRFSKWQSAVEQTIDSTRQIWRATSQFGYAAGRQRHPVGYRWRDSMAYLAESVSYVGERLHLPSAVARAQYGQYIHDMLRSQVHQRASWQNSHGLICVWERIISMRTIKAKLTTWLKIGTSAIRTSPDL